MSTAGPPFERLGVVRAAVFGFGAIYVAARSPTIIDVGGLPTSRFDPVGGAAWLDAPLSPSVLALATLVTVAACAGAAVGWRFRITGAVAATGLLLVLSHRLSWGQVLHTENLLVMHALILAATPAADGWSLDARRNRPAEGADRRAAHRWSLWTLAAVTASGYAIAAWAKMRNGGLDWMSGEVLRSHIAHDNLRKHLLGDPSSPMARFIVPHGWLFAPMAWASMVLEVGALGALVASARVRIVWVAATWVFHVAVLAFMAILFPYQLLGVAFLPFVAAERLTQPLDAISRRALRGLRLRPHSRRAT